jgi:hypothetical protein
VGRAFESPQARQGDLTWQIEDCGYQIEALGVAITGRRNLQSSIGNLK